MRNRLFQSAITVFAFWWVVGVVLFTFSTPEHSQAVLERLAAVAPWFDYDIPEHLGDYNSLYVQYQAIRYWTVSVLGIGALVVAASWLGVWIWTLLNRRKIEASLKPADRWRALKVTLGPMPKPILPASEPIGIKPKGKMKDQVEAMPKGAQQLFIEVLQMLSAHPEIPVGDGHGDITLLQHTLRVVRGGLRIESPDPLLPLALAAHDLGKIISFVKKGGEWHVVRQHDTESARLLRLLPSAESLDPEELEVVAEAVANSHSIWAVVFDQEKEPEKYQRTVSLIHQMREADGCATAEEKAQLLKNKPTDEIVFETFMEAIPAFPMNTKATEGNGKRKVGWRSGNRGYYLENQVRAELSRVLPRDLAAALEVDYRPKDRVPKFTEILLKRLHEEGCLVHRIDEWKQTPHQALWKIKAGSRDYSAAFIVDLPEDKAHLMGVETHYDMKVLCPHFRSASEELADPKVLGAVFKPPRPVGEQPPQKKKAGGDSHETVDRIKKQAQQAAREPEKAEPSDKEKGEKAKTTKAPSSAKAEPKQPKRKPAKNENKRTVKLAPKDPGDSPKKGRDSKPGAKRKPAPAASPKPDAKRDPKPEGQKKDPEKAASSAPELDFTADIMSAATPPENKAPAKPAPATAEEKTARPSKAAKPPQLPASKAESKDSPKAATPSVEKAESEERESSASKSTEKTSTEKPRQNAALHKAKSQGKTRPGKAVKRKRPDPMRHLFKKS